MAANKSQRKGRAAAPKPKAQENGRKSESQGDLVDHAWMRVLGHRGRVKILSILNERVASPKELEQVVDEGLSQISYHIRVLREEGFIEQDRTEQRRGAIEHYYRATQRALLPADAWKNLSPTMMEGISVGILREFFEDAEASMEAGIFDDPTSHLSWTPLVLDKEGWSRVAEILKNTMDEVFDVQVETSERMASEGTDREEGVSVTVTLAGFLSARSPEEGKKAPATKRRYSP
ncbi:MAG TPA: winged helix-turn-helix domain-containing protein [Solirubrobacterales bacterium]|nr:winged helix-turn-helix domain-containing protein [Solirubrobacterales bacterium]